MNTFNFDGYETALLGHRRFDVAGAASVTPALLYSMGGLYGRIVDLPSDKAVARGVEIEGDEEGVAVMEMDRLKVLPALADALRWSRLSGGAALVLLTDDALVNEPLDASRLGQISEIRVFSLTQISADTRLYTDFTKANFGRPQWYKIRAASGDRAAFLVHESRVIEISGEPLPDSMRADGIYWSGRPSVDRAYAAVRRLTESLGLAQSVLQRKQQGIYSMTGLAELIREELEPMVQKRINMVDAVRGVLNTVAIDADDAYDLKDANLSGIDALIQEFQIAVSAETGIPVTLLFGRSPGGMNATGDADFQGYHEMVEGLQRTRLTPALERIVSLIYAQSAVTGTAPEDWQIEWPALESPNETEKAATRKVNADALVQEMAALTAAMGAGAMSEEEAREYLIDEDLFGIEPDAQAPSGAGEYGNQT